MFLHQLQKKTPYLYEIGIDKEQTGILALNQSFDNGWVLFRRGECHWSKVMPWLCKYESNHTIYNGWANAWEVSVTPGTYYVVYWPQYLQFIGYAILVIFMGIIGVFYLKSSKRV